MQNNTNAENNRVPPFYTKEYPAPVIPVMPESAMVPPFTEISPALWADPATRKTIVDYIERTLAVHN